MDAFVRNKLTEWGLSKWIQSFEDEEVDKENFYSLGDREIENMITKMGPRGKFKEKLKLLKAEQQTAHQDRAVPAPRFISCVVKREEGDEEDDFTQVRPSSHKQVKRKRKLDHQGRLSGCQSPASKRRRDKKPTSSSATILSEVKNTMNDVMKKLSNEDTMFINFLKTKICNLKTDKRELVGVFGKTGAGKSSLINAVIEEENLLPSGSVSACTSVMIKVEANMRSSKYQAEIEFITKEDWRDEVWSYYIHKNDADQEDENNTNGDDSDDDDIVEKLSALYGKEWKNMSLEKLMDDRHFSGIPQFLKGTNIVLEHESAKKLSELFVKYTRSDSGEEEGKAVKRWYWPLVKCVTLRVPNNDLLQHVTIVDLPGNGDCNKSRDKMWKEIVGCCSTVWIVTEINRAASEKEAWEILKNACGLMGNGGECQRIHFICTKSDLNAHPKDSSAAPVQDLIREGNKNARTKVENKFNAWRKENLDIPFDVFTVSSHEFLHRNCLTPCQTEIPKLQKVLEDLNDPHPVALNYVSGAHGILSLIQGARRREVAEKKTEACRKLEENMRWELVEVRKPMEEAHEAFERCLTEGVERSKSRCEAKLKSTLKPRGTGQGFWKMLKCAVKNNGAYKNKKKQINFNRLLSSWLIDSIDQEFMKTFPIQQKQGPFNGAINAFSLDTEGLIKTFKEVELHLGFLKSEEENVKNEVNSLIRKRKKEIYGSLMKTIEADMQQCYEEAAKCSGTGTLENMKSIIERHVHDSKKTMFERAKDEMLTQLDALKEDVLKVLEETLKESIEQSLKTDDFSVPDVSEELEEVRSQQSELKQQTT